VTATASSCRAAFPTATTSRCGAIARFSPVMESVVDFAAHGGLVWGSATASRFLCETGLLPGALIRNDVCEFRCAWTDLVVEKDDTLFTSASSGARCFRIPISHGEGNYFADPATLSRLEQNGQVVFRYCRPDGMVVPEAKLRTAPCTTSPASSTRRAMCSE